MRYNNICLILLEPLTKENALLIKHPKLNDAQKDTYYIGDNNTYVVHVNNRMNNYATYGASVSYDQADMNKSIKNLCGLTPKELLSQLYNTV